MGNFLAFRDSKEAFKGMGCGLHQNRYMGLDEMQEDGRMFYYVNTHLDHVGQEAQKNGLKLILDHIASINPKGYPMVLTGDFNITPDNKALAGLDAVMQSTRKIAEKTDSLGTYNGWGKANEVIDYIYCSGFSKCVEYQTVTKKYADRAFVSDHYPIFARLIFLMTLYLMPISFSSSMN